MLLRLRNKFRASGEYQLNIHPTAKIRGCTFSIKGKGNTITIGSGVNIRDCDIEVNGEQCTLSIGDKTIIGHGSYLSVREKGTHLHIGEDCMLSRNVKIMTSDGHNIIKNGKRVNHARDISIGNSVWLADNVTVLKGVAIGDNSIVGINATLTKSIGSSCVAVGNPARVVQNDVSWEHKLIY